MKSRKDVIAIVCVMALALGILGCQPPRELQPPGTPRVFFPETSHDFGDVPPNSELHYSFPFFNEGEAPLRITEIVNSCGCTASTATQSTIEPGDTSEIDVTVHLYSTLGPTHKTIAVHTNDPFASQKILHVTANVVEDADEP